VPHVLILFHPADTAVAVQLAIALGGGMADGVMWCCHRRAYTKSGAFVDNELYGMVPPSKSSGVIAQVLFLAGYGAQGRRCIESFETRRRAKKKRGEPYMLHYRIKSLDLPFNSILREVTNVLYKFHVAQGIWGGDGSGP
jgi:hypothetical protein